MTLVVLAVAWPSPAPEGVLPFERASAGPVPRICSVVRHPEATGCRLAPVGAGVEGTGVGTDFAAPEIGGHEARSGRRKRLLAGEGRVSAPEGGVGPGVPSGGLPGVVPGRPDAPGLPGPAADSRSAVLAAVDGRAALPAFAGPKQTQSHVVSHETHVQWRYRKDTKGDSAFLIRSPDRWPTYHHTIRYHTIQFLFYWSNIFSGQESLEIALLLPKTTAEAKKEGSRKEGNNSCFPDNEFLALDHNSPILRPSQVPHLSCVTVNVAQM